MDLTVLKKKISSYRTPKGRITSIPDELLGELLHAWEQWSGPASGFYKALGVDYRKMGSLMGRAKRLKREGAFDGHEFTLVNVEESPVQFSAITSTGGIEVVWDQHRVIRFSQVNQLIEFLDYSPKSKIKNITPSEETGIAA